tara:strand:- start:393 stop:1439 length:1047 start_codon:yes stop_codon:yes gene_type:complete
MECGIVGLPGSGKTSLFQALTAHAVSVEVGTLKPNIGQADIPDPRLYEIARYVPTKKVVPARLELVDIPGISVGGGASYAAVLSHIRMVAALCHVINCFDKDVDPVLAYGDLKLELILSDIEVIENSLERAKKSAQSGDEEAKRRLEALQKALALVEAERPVSAADWSVSEELVLRGYGLLSAKPMLVVANVAEDDLDGACNEVHALKDIVAKDSGTMVEICASLESEISELPEEGRIEMLNSMGLQEPAVGPLARALNELLGLTTFYTAGEKEVRSWVIRQSATAPEAGGSVHSDIERGFIRAECYHVDELLDLGSEKAVKEAGKLRSEGKQYVMKDGDVVHFLFNV